MAVEQDWVADPERLRQLRRERGLSREELAVALGCAARTIAKWENGVAVPNRISFRALCGVLAVEPEQLMADED